MGRGSRSAASAQSGPALPTAPHCPQSCVSPPTAPSGPDLSDPSFPCNANKQKRKETTSKEERKKRKKKKKKKEKKEKRKKRKKKKKKQRFLKPQKAARGPVCFADLFHSPRTHQHGMRPPRPAARHRAALRRARSAQLSPHPNGCGFALAAAQRCPQVPPKRARPREVSLPPEAARELRESALGMLCGEAKDALRAEVF